MVSKDSAHGDLVIFELVAMHLVGSADRGGPHHGAGKLETRQD